ncbi:hypothetical protein [Calothrix sp. 336/3]|nr:hypothetical protein [Calothrix sp. 336/3]
MSWFAGVGKPATTTGLSAYQGFYEHSYAKSRVNTQYLRKFWHF